MDGLGQHFLFRAAFPLDDDREIIEGYPAGRVKKMGLGGIPGNHVVEVIQGPGPERKGGVAAPGFLIITDRGVHQI